MMQAAMNSRDPLHARPHGNVRQTRHSTLVAVLVASVALGGIIAFANSDDTKSIATAGSTPGSGSIADSVAAPVVGGASGSVAGVVTPDSSVGVDTSATVAADPAATTADSAVDPATADTATASGVVDLDEPTTGTGCLMTVESVRSGAIGDSVACLQGALSAAGYYSGPASGTFDQATDNAVRAMQTDRDLFVDGVVGRESAISLGIWPAEGSQVVHTPAPPEGAVDSLGFPLSSVASTGADTPPLPANSGSGKRLVYDRAGQRVWAVSADEVVIRSWLVSGSKYSNEIPGTHHVYSKSEKSTAWNGKAILPHMVRWLKTDIGNIGFHGIPIHVSDGTAYQTEKELGQRLSGGCQRQANRDADFVWAFADIGTTVVVI